ncbi:PGAP1-like protein-domain-containing protein [Entophlyctis helioformis]|nr:PGAP1-like protein-domain-containing protein [Entophlyctis helioformis]
MLARRSRQRLLLAAASLGSLALLALAGWVFLAYRIDPKGCDGNYIASHYVPMRNFSCSARPALDARYTLLLHRDQDDAAKDDEVRTFANVAQRMRDWKRDDGAFGIPFLDIYAIDTDEELCAFSEAALVNQAIYASEAIAYILSLYSSIPDGPRSVYVVGHSMGGFVARLIPVQAALMPDSPFRKGSIEAILTLSSPHNHPPAPLSRGMANLYRTVNQQWRSMAPSVANITIASVAGGRKDLILNSVLTELDGVVDPSRGVHTYSTALTGVWASTDHEGSVWCNQLLETVAEAIYDMRNPQLPYRTAPPETRMQTLHRYFNASLDRTIGEPKPMSARSTKYKVISKPVITATLRDDDDINNHLLDLPLLHMQLNASAASKSKASISPPRPVIRILTNSSQLSQQVDPFLQYENPVTKVMPRIPFRSRLVPLATTAPFEILFFWRSSPRAATRPAWTLFELDTRDAVPANATDISLYTDVGSLSHGFLETSIADTQDPVTVKVSSLGLIFGFFKMIDTPGMMTRIVFPRVTDSHLKYHMQIVPECNETPLFQSFIEYSAPPSLDSKFTANISDVLVHWIASLAPLVGDYATFLPSAIVAAMLMYAAEWQSASSQSGKAQSFEGTVLGSYQRIIRILFAVDIAYPILASLGVLPKTLFLGPRDVFVNIFGITFWFSISTGVLLTLFYP